MNKYLKYSLRGIGFFILLLLVLYLVVYCYVLVNKKKIVKQVTSEISQKISGDVAIDNIDISVFGDFPRISVILKKVSIKDSLFSQHKHPFLEADEVYVKLNIRKLISKQPPLSGLKVVNGNVYLYTDTSGYTNQYLFKPKKDPKDIASSPKGNNELKDIELRDVRVVLDDRQKLKLHDFSVTHFKSSISEIGNVLLFDIDNDVTVNSLAFNLPRGSFIKDKKVAGKYQLRFDKKLKQLQFDSIDLKIGGIPFNLAGGKFDLAGDSPQFNIRVHVNKILYSVAKTLLTPKIADALKIVEVDQPLKADVNLGGPLRGGDPFIKVYWVANKTNLVTPFLNFENASFNGSYSNEVVPGLPRKDPNSEIDIKNFTATWQGLPITSNHINITNLFSPTLICDLKSSFPLTSLSEIMNSAAIHFDKGEGLINLTYKGPLAKNNNTNSFVNGVIAVNNGIVHYAPRDVLLNNVNGRIVFKSSDVFVENLQCVVLNNKIVMQGAAKNLLTFLGSQPSKASIDWTVYSPSLNLASFAYLLKPQKKAAVKKKTSNQLQKTADQIDAVLEQGSLKVKLKADKLNYKKFEGTNAEADLSLLNDRYILRKVTLQHAGGKMDLSGSMLHSANNFHQAQVNVSMANMDVSKVFYAFNNFGQDGITAENLRGNLSSHVSMSMALNDDGAVYKESVNGVVDFSLKNGALIDFEPLKKMQVSIFKKRDFGNITFAELKDKLEIKKEEVKINPMQIQSSVFTMFVEGIFSMKGTTDMLIQVPLSNLKKRGIDYVPENKEGKKGGSVWIRGKTGKDGKVAFKLDLFHKYKKEKDQTVPEESQ